MLPPDIRRGCHALPQGRSAGVVRIRGFRASASVRAASRSPRACFSATPSRSRLARSPGRVSRVRLEELADTGASQWWTSHSPGLHAAVAERHALTEPCDLEFFGCTHPIGGGVRDRCLSVGAARRLAIHLEGYGGETLRMRFPPLTTTRRRPDLTARRSTTSACPAVRSAFLPGTPRCIACTRNAGCLLENALPPAADAGCQRRPRAARSLWSLTRQLP
jgi:hypothetical protein